MSDLDDLLIAACPKPCQRITTTEVQVLEDGTEELIAGTPPPPLCAPCPTREEQRPPIRHIRVLLPPPPEGDGDEATPAPIPHERYEAAPEEPSEATAAPDPEPGEPPEQETVPDGGLPIPPSWTSAHPNHPDYREPDPREGGVPSRPARPGYDAQRLYGIGPAGSDHQGF